MRFGKPPVVEVWISLEFDPNENKQQFDLELVERYLEPYQDELPKREVARERELTVVQTSPTDLPKSLQIKDRVQHIRQWNENRSRMLQVGDDQLAFHLVKVDEDTPGYSKVREAAEPKLESYVGVFEPSQIRNATLHYLDIIDIPIPDSGKIELQDFFPHAADLPESPFGLTEAFVQQFQVACPVDEGPLFVRLQNHPAPTEDQVIRFRLEWHKQSSAVNSLDLSQVWQRMDVAHEYMRRCFREVLSPATLNLFEPLPEDEPA